MTPSPSMCGSAAWCAAANVRVAIDEPRDIGLRFALENAIRAVEGRRQSQGGMGWPRADMAILHMKLSETDREVTMWIDRGLRLAIEIASHARAHPEGRT